MVDAQDAVRCDVATMVDAVKNRRNVAPIALFIIFAPNAFRTTPSYHFSEVVFDGPVL